MRKCVVVEVFTSVRFSILYAWFAASREPECEPDGDDKVNNAKQLYNAPDTRLPLAQSGCLQRKSRLLLHSLWVIAIWAWIAVYSIQLILMSRNSRSD